MENVSVDLFDFDGQSTPDDFFDRFDLWPFSDTDYRDIHYRPLNRLLAIAYAGGETLLAILIVFGNSLVILSYIKFKGLRHERANAFLFHLSLADLLVGLTMPLHVVMFTFPKLFGVWFLCVGMVSVTVLTELIT